MMKVRMGGNRYQYGGAVWDGPEPARPGSGALSEYRASMLNPFKQHSCPVMVGLNPELSLSGPDCREKPGLRCVGGEPWLLIIHVWGQRRKGAHARQLRAW